MRDFDWFEPNTYELDKKGLSLTRWQLQRLAEEYTPEVVQRAIDSLNDIRPERMKAGRIFSGGDSGRGALRRGRPFFFCKTPTRTAERA